MERTQIGLLLAKVESSYGTDPTPTGAANLVATTKDGITWGPEFDRLQRSILDGTFEKVNGYNVLPRVSFSFRAEVRGNRTTGLTDTDITSGDSAQAIQIDPLLRACDLAATYTPETTNGARDGYVVYTPTTPSDQGTSVTFYFYTGLKLHKVTGAKGTFKLTGEAGKMGYIDFTFMGLYNAPSDASIPGSLTWLDTKPPQFINASATIGSFSPIFRKLELELGNKLTRRDDANTATTGVKGFLVTDRNPTLTIDPESIAEATHPVWADLAASTSRTISALFGSTSGNKILLTAVGESVKADYGDVDGNRVQNITYNLNRALLSDTPGNFLQLKFF